MLIGYRAFGQRAARLAGAGLDAQLPPPSDFVLEAWISDQVDLRRYRELKLDGSEWHLTWIAVGPAAATCAARLTAAEATTVDSQVRQLEARLQQGPPPCAGQTTPGTYRFRWQRAGSSADVWTIEGSQECLNAESAWSSLAFTLGRIPLDAVSHGRASCR
jgi:hypothetical protein